MEPTPKQQAIGLINQANNILIVPGDPDGDSISSALALYLVFQKLGKQASICAMVDIPTPYSFLPAIDKIARELQATKDFIITLLSPQGEPEKLSYNYAEGKLNVIITPRDGQYRPEDVSFSTGGYKYDLIVTVDAPNPAMLSRVHEAHPTLFTEVPVINIDHHASNAGFGTINLVDITATSTGEILVGLIEAMGVQFDADIATCLLTGIIDDTGSFQHANTTPKSLTIAAQMVGFGARQQEIIKQLFKTRSLSTLKLWGRVLSRLGHDPEHRFVWGTVSLEDMEAVGATKEQVTGLIDELMTSVPGSDIVILLSEKEPNLVSGSIRTQRGVDATEVAALFGGGGHPGAAGFKLMDMTITEAEALVTDKVRSYQTARLTPAG